MPGENSGILAGYCTAVTGTGADPYTRVDEMDGLRFDRCVAGDVQADDLSRYATCTGDGATPTTSAAVTSPRTTMNKSIAA